jgi:hypothetical protein
MDTAEWTSLFYELTGADPATTNVQARPSQLESCGKEAIPRGVENSAVSMYFQFLKLS